MSITESDLQSAQQQLDAHLREIIARHFQPVEAASASTAAFRTKRRGNQPSPLGAGESFAGFTL